VGWMPEKMRFIGPVRVGSGAALRRAVIADGLEGVKRRAA